MSQTTTPTGSIVTVNARQEMRLTADHQPLLSKQPLGDDRVLCCQLRTVYDNGYTTDWTYEAVSSSTAAHALMKQLHTPAPAAPAAPSKPITATPLAPPTPRAVTPSSPDLETLKLYGFLAQLEVARSSAAPQQKAQEPKDAWGHTIKKFTPPAARTCADDQA